MTKGWVSGHNSLQTCTSYQDLYIGPVGYKIGEKAKIMAWFLIDGMGKLLKDFDASKVRTVYAASLFFDENSFLRLRPRKIEILMHQS